MNNGSSQDKFSLLLLGVMMSLFGLVAIFKSGFYSTKESYYIDLGQYHWLFGIIVMIIGFAFIYVSRNASKKK